MVLDIPKMAFLVFEDRDYCNAISVIDRETSVTVSVKRR